GATLSLHTRGDRQVQLLTDDETVFRVPGVEEAGLDDIQVGNRVLSVAQTREGDLYARQVIVPPQGMPRVAGEVTEIEGQTLVLETPRGAVQALTDGDTVFRVPGVEEATLADVTPGDQVVCAGAWQDPGTFAARIVQVRPPR
ncbi:MAG: hypothetical protein PVI59_06895, partial [Anaerolineae bacterium]